MARFQAGQTLSLEKFPVDCVLGAYPEERGTPRTVFVTAGLHGDFSKAAATDALADALDYDALSQRIARMLAEEKHHLIERAAWRVCDLCLEERGVESATVRLEKPDVPVPGASAVFTLTRIRE